MLSYYIVKVSYQEVQDPGLGGNVGNLKKSLKDIT